MIQLPPALFATWGEEIWAFLQRSTAVVIGLARPSGELIYASDSLRQLMGGAAGPVSLADELLAPAFDTLHQDVEGELLFSGRMTFAANSLRSVVGEIRRKQGHLLLLAAYDVEELMAVNTEVMQLNGEISKLQREIALEHSRLQRTLDELRETQAMLIHSEKMNALGQLTAGVAHEINNPISFVNSNLHSMRQMVDQVLGAFNELEMLISQNGSAEQQAMVRDIRQRYDLDFIRGDVVDLFRASFDGMTRVRKIVESLRSFSRLDESDVNVVDLRESLESTLVIAQPSLGDRVAVTLDLDGVPPIRCYAAQLNQAFLNIIINASQAIDGHGSLAIRGRQDGDDVVLTFTDSGAGIPAEIMDKVFDPFFTTKPVGQGTGLGLSIAYKIVTELHGGTITVDSSPGRGTTFTIRLPQDVVRHGNGSATG
ncbi:MAG: ATP-binding protein [Chloroflexota bacterium]